MTHAVKEANRQTPVPTNRNYIRGLKSWSSKHIIAKAVLYVAISRCSGDRGKDKCLTQGGLGIDSVSICQEVTGPPGGRGHSSYW